jgi:hypothetical protein
MRLAIIFSAVLVAAVATPASARQWDEYISRTDGFRVNVPGQPTITDTTYKSEYGADLPARIYSVERGKERYSITT